MSIFQDPTGAMACDQPLAGNEPSPPQTPKHHMIPADVGLPEFESPDVDGSNVNEGDEQDGNNKGDEQDGNNRGDEQDANNEGDEQDGNNGGDEQDANNEGDEQDANDAPSTPSPTGTPEPKRKPMAAKSRAKRASTGGSNRTAKTRRGKTSPKHKAAPKPQKRKHKDDVEAKMHSVFQLDLAASMLYYAL